ncbi:MAG: hypothetical protein H0V44_08945 [Planctomycetes bacterium]|nr:hypothetical protein [Planctomycetota bacterium]
MSRRRRIWLIIALVAVGLPLIGFALVQWYLHSGRIERRIESQYSQRLPGRMTIGRFEMASSIEAVLHDVAIGDVGEQPLLTVKKIRARIHLRRLRLDSLRIEGARMRLDAKSWDLFNRIVDAEQAIPNTKVATRATPITIDGSLVTESGLAVDDIRVKALDHGPIVSADVTARYGAEPVALRIDTRKTPQGTYRLVIEGGCVRGPVAPVLDALVSIGLLEPVPAALRAFLPTVADASGTVVEKDVVGDGYTGSLQARWADGEGQAVLTADTHRLNLAKLRIVDAGVVQGEGRLTADLDGEEMTVEFTKWNPGPRLGLPNQVPIEDILKIVPALRLKTRSREHDQSVNATLYAPGQSKSSVDIEWKPDAPLTIHAIEMPLALAQPFLPKDLLVNGGQAATVRMTIDDGLRGCYLEARQARFSVRGWSFGPTDGTCQIDPHADGFSIAAELPVGSISYSGSGAAGTMKVSLKRVEDLLIRIHGPARLPDLRGALSFEMALSQDATEVKGHLTRLALDGLTLPDLLQDLVAAIRGDFVWRDERLEARFGGQLRKGAVRLPDRWLDIAARTPLFTAKFQLTPPQGYAPAALDVDEILVRAANEQGEPLAGGYSAQLGGNLTATGTGQIIGVVDHGDLAWVNRMLPLQEGSMAGQGAITLASDLMFGEMMRLEGSFLPLNADLRIGNSFQATGITGAVKFTMAKKFEDK